MKKYKLVHVTSSLCMGGAEKILYMLVKALQQKGYDQVVVYVHEGPFVAKLQELGIATYQLRGFFWCYDLLFFIRLYRLLKKERPSVVHSLLWAANVASRICGWIARIPVVSVYHNNVDQDGYVRSLFDRLTLFWATHNIAVSEQVAQSITERSWLPAKRISVITNGIEFAHDTVTCRSKRDLGIPDDCFVIGAVGRLVPVKRFDYLIDTYATCGIASSCLVIIGSGPLEKELRNQVERLQIGGKVHFLTDHEALSYYQLFDCFVQTSEKEGVSLALLEAMSFCKVVVVMGNNGYHPVIRHDYDGFIVNPWDQTELVEALCDLHNNQFYRAILGRRAQETVQNRFGLPRMVREYQRLFDQLSL